MELHGRFHQKRFKNRQIWCIIFDDFIYECKGISIYEQLINSEGQPYMKIIQNRLRLNDPTNLEKIKSLIDDELYANLERYMFGII